MRSRRSTRCPPSQRISPPAARDRDRDPARRPDTREPRRADAARCRQAHRGTDPGVGRQARDDSAAGARRGVGLAAGGAHDQAPRGCSAPTSTNAASGPGWNAATASWRTRRPTCGSVSRWWRRQMRFGRGHGYDRSAGRRARSAMRPFGRADRFCESCGAALSEIRRIAIPRPGRSAEGPCADCGNEAYFDEYCTVCGHRRAEPDRDEADLGGIVLITDRGIEHARNEDAAAAGIVVGSDTERPDAIAVAVCDGVSTSDDAHAAAVAASKAGVDAMLAALVASRNGTRGRAGGSGRRGEGRGRGRDGLRRSAPSCTYTAATVVPTSAGTVQITVGNVGDSRAYWLPEPPAPAQQLTVDDSLAQELITAGAAADSEAVQRGAHTLTRWLGADTEAKPWSESSVQTITAVGPGCAVAVHRRTLELPARRRRHRTILHAVPTRPRRRARSPNSHWMPAARTTSPSQSSRSEGRHEFG